MADQGIFAYSLTVVANGISSAPFAPIWAAFGCTGVQLGTFPMPYAMLAQAVANVPDGGIIDLKGNLSSPETLTISKPMTLAAFGGPATVGR